MTQAASPPASSSPAAPPVDTVRSLRPGGTLLVFLLAGLIAGGASLAAVVLLKDFYTVPVELTNVSPEDEQGQARLAAAAADVARKNLFLTIPLLGAVVGAVMGLAGGVRDRSSGRATVGTLLGLVLGGGFGLASASLGPDVLGPRLDAAIPHDAPFETKENWAMVRTLAVQATFWGLIALAAAAAATVPTRRVGLLVRSGAGALVAAILAMMIYQALLGNVFQLSRFQLLMPHDPGPMAAWTLPTGILLGLALGRLSVVSPPKAA